MQQTDLRQEKKYCARLGWALVLTVGCSLVWQVFLMAVALAGRLNSGVALYYLLTLVGYYILALPLAFRVCRIMPVPPMTQRSLTPRLMGRWFVIGIALMWICLLYTSRCV